MVKSLPAMQETWVQSLGWEDALKKETDNPLQYFCLENSMEKGAWVGGAIVHGVAKSWIQLSSNTFTVTEGNRRSFPFLSFIPLCLYLLLDYAPESSMW